MIMYMVCAWAIALLLGSTALVAIWEGSGNKTVGWRARRTLLALLGVLAGPISVPAAAVYLIIWLLVKACGR